jgi:hypothetical protein
MAFTARTSGSRAQPPGCAFSFADSFLLAAHCSTREPYQEACVRNLVAAHMTAAQMCQAGDFGGFRNYGMVVGIALEAGADTWDAPHPHSPSPRLPAKRLYLDALHALVAASTVRA